MTSSVERKERGAQMVFTTNVPISLGERIAQHAIQAGVSRSAWIEEIVRAHFAALDARKEAADVA
jgi:hypothetical protein